jgi:hypothetical protein
MLTQQLKYIPIIFLLCNLFSCTTQENIDLIELIEVAEKSIMLDSISREGGYTQVLKLDGRYILAKLNHASRCIYLYDWESAEVVNKIFYNVEGPDGVGLLWGFYAVNPDSIYMISGSQYRITLINSEGIVLKRYSLLPELVNYREGSNQVMASKDAYVALPTLNNRLPAVKLNNYLIMSCVPQFRGDSEEFFNYGLVHVKLNLQSGEMNYFRPYPELYLKKGLLYPSQYASTFFTANKNNSTIITSFPVDHHIYVTDINTGLITSHLAKSKYIDEVAHMNKPSNVPSENSTVAFNNDHYHQIIYDPYNKYYLRMVWHPGPGSLYVSGGDNYSTMNIYTSIVVLDSTFNKIGEVEIKEKGHTNAPVFFTAEGMWLSFDSNSDDYMRFKLYKFELKK